MSDDGNDAEKDLREALRRLGHAQASISDMQSRIADAEARAGAASEREAQATARAAKAVEKYEAAESLKQGAYVEVIRDTFEGPRADLVKAIKTESVRAMLAAAITTVIAIVISVLVAQFYQVKADKAQSDFRSRLEFEIGQLNQSIGESTGKVAELNAATHTAMRSVADVESRLPLIRDDIVGIKGDIIGIKGLVAPLNERLQKSADREEARDRWDSARYELISIIEGESDKVNKYQTRNDVALGFKMFILPNAPQGATAGQLRDAMKDAGMSVDRFTLKDIIQWRQEFLALFLNWQLILEHEPRETPVAQEDTLLASARPQEDATNYGGWGFSVCQTNGCLRNAVQAYLDRLQGRRSAKRSSQRGRHGR